MMKLSISNSEWNVLSRLLYNSGVNTFKVSEIIKEKKKILQDFKESLIIKKHKELEKLKKDRKYDELKILKFERELDERLNDEFKSKFYKVAQDIEGSAF